MIPKRFRSYQVVHYTGMLMLFPGIAFLTRKLWCGTVTNEEVLREKYAYLNDVRDINRGRLQELLDNAKQGKPGGHEAGEAWDTKPTFHGPWDRPTRAGEKPKGM